MNGNADGVAPATAGRNGIRVGNAIKSSFHGLHSIPGGAASAGHGSSALTAIRKSANEGCWVDGGAAQSRSRTSIPVWLAALAVSSCVTGRASRDPALRWDCSSGRATYTNYGFELETVQPLGVRLEHGQTVAVYWAPGETGYTVEVYG